jgi:hypothetical protein
MSTNYEAPHCATSYIFLSLHRSLCPNILPTTTFWNTVYTLTLRDQVSHPYEKQLAELGYGFVYFNLYIPRQQEGRQKMNWMQASIYIGTQISNEIVLNP